MDEVEDICVEMWVKVRVELRIAMRIEIEDRGECGSIEMKVRVEVAT